MSAITQTTKFGNDCAQINRRLGISTPAKFHFDSTQSLLRFVQADYGWAITSAMCILQDTAASKGLTILPCPHSVPRSFQLMHHAGELDQIAAQAAQKFRSVFDQLLNGPWPRIAPQISDMLAKANA